MNAGDALLHNDIQHKGVTQRSLIKVSTGGNIKNILTKFKTE